MKDLTKKGLEDRDASIDIQRDSPIVFIIDDEDGVRAGLNRLLRSLGLRSEGFPSAQAFLDRLPYHGTGCIMLDLQMPGMTGPELQELMLRDGISLPVIYLTGHGDVRSSVTAMQNGAMDFLTKPADEALIARSVFAAISRHVLIHKHETLKNDIATCLSRLSAREREVMEFVIDGRQNKQIARDLGIAEKTVKVHRARVMQKMQTRSVADLVRMCEAVGVEAKPAGRSASEQAIDDHSEAVNGVRALGLERRT